MTVSFSSVLLGVSDSNVSTIILAPHATHLGEGGCCTFSHTFQFAGSIDPGIFLQSEVQPVPAFDPNIWVINLHFSSSAVPAGPSSAPLSLGGFVRVALDYDYAPVPELHSAVTALVSILLLAYLRKARAK